LIGLRCVARRDQFSGDNRGAMRGIYGLTGSRLLFDRLAAPRGR
jgi:hypothetical protein